MLKEKLVTSVQLTQYCLNRIRDKNSDINAIITVNEEAALVAASESDRRRERGNDQLVFIYLL